MGRRRKRASMREGPLADLFRSTIDDPPADPPEAPRPGERRAEPEQPAEELAQQQPSEDIEPRFGREDPVEKRRHGHEEPTAETPGPPTPSPSPDPPSPPEPQPPAPEPEPTPPQISSD